MDRDSSSYTFLHVSDSDISQLNLVLLVASISLCPFNYINTNYCLKHFTISFKTFFSKKNSSVRRNIVYLCDIFFKFTYFCHRQFLLKPIQSYASGTASTAVLRLASKAQGYYKISDVL
jgi:hypothetical protein